MTFNGDDFQEYLVFVAPGYHLAVTFNNLSRLRDFHRDDTLETWGLMYSAQLVILKTLATFINASLIVVGKNAQHSQFHPFPEVVVLPSIFWRTFQNYRNETYHLIDKIPHEVQLVQVDATDIGFSFCHVPQQEKLSFWEFGIFLDPFDECTWGLLATSLLLIILLCGKVFKTIMSIVSATLAVGTQSLYKKRKIFLMWLLACMFLTNFYSGELTSKISVPPKEVVMTHFHHLLEQNYTLSLPEYASKLVMFGFKSHLSKSHSRTKKILLRLLEKVVIRKVENIYKDLISDKRYATIGAWPGVHTIIWVHKVMSTRDRGITGLTPKCYVGQELVTLGEKFFIFLPPKNLQVVVGLHRLIESGIYQRWEQEDHGLQHSRRVQDRIRVKSPTKVLELEVTMIPPQGLKGKMVTMFLLRGVCIIISFCVLCFEMYLENAF